MSNFSIFLTVFIISCSISLSLEDSASPDMVIEMFRHGARGPVEKRFDNTWDSPGYGSLTDAGVRMQYLLGAALAKKYPKILGQPFDPTKIYVKTSRSVRCFESAQAQINGVFQGVEPTLKDDYPQDRAVPPFDADIIAELLKNPHYSDNLPEDFNNITFNSVSGDDDIVLETPATCPALYLDAIDTLKRDEIITLWQKNLTYTVAALEELGISATNPVFLGQLGDTIYCNYFQNKVLPGNITFGSELWKNITFAGSLFSVLSTFTSKRQRQLLSVPLFDEILGHLEAKANGTTPVEFVFLSTHDTTLMTILSSFDIVSKECLIENFFSDRNNGTIPHPHCVYPPFASTIIIEFYSNNSSPYIVFKYNDQPITICGDNIECPYEDFKTLVKQATNGYTIEDYNDTCYNTLLNSLKSLARPSKLWEKIKSIF